MTTLRLTPAEDGRTVEIAPGDEVVLDLHETPGTGFRWNAEIDSNLELESSEWTAAPSAAVGGGGVRRFRIRAVRAGDGHVRLKHWREWLGDASVTARLEFTLRVR